jgi:hypothetical protein
LILNLNCCDLERDELKAMRLWAGDDELEDGVGLEDDGVAVGNGVQLKDESWFAQELGSKSAVGSKQWA